MSGMVNGMTDQIIGEVAPLSNTMIVSRSALVSAMEAEITDYFSCPSVSGLALSQHEVNYIIGGILRRLSGQVEAGI
jgi:hypothetical protein